MIARAPILDHLSALADSTRSRLLLLLEGQELTVGELCAVLQLPQSTVSRHLKILADEGWLAARGEGSSRYYSMLPARLDAAAGRLWQVVREQIAGGASTQDDRRRLDSVLAQRRTRSQQFFSTAAGSWDAMRADLIGRRTDLLALLDLVDDSWTVGDLGCGTGHVSAALAPCVRRVIAVDESGPMLSAARERLAGIDNVELRAGAVESLPIDDASLDAAVLFLVAHFVAEPARAIAEAARVVRPGGKLLVVDLMPHDRDDLRVQLGHVWQGFSAEQMEGWLGSAGFGRARYRALPADPSAKGPTLFAASGVREAARVRDAGSGQRDLGPEKLEVVGSGETVVDRARG